MDWRLVTYAFALPDQAKWGAGLTKRVLRDAMRGHLPEALRTRKSKMGFNAPLAHWFSGSLREWLLDQVSDRAFVESDLWFGGKAKAFVERKSRSGRWNWREAEQIWLLVHAHLWQQAFSGGRMNVG
jgi:asparagine synthase (glutamine-hydrolysing)